MNHLIAIVVIALFAQGVFTSMGQGMILEPVKNFLARFITGKWAHPFYDCPRCMVSVWGIPALIVTMFAPWWVCIPIYALCAVGLQELLQR